MIKKQLDDLQKVLPECPGISGSDEYSRSSVLILTAEFGGEIFFILQKRSRRVRQGGEISFPGGFFDPEKDKSSEETAIRETMEEMGLERSKIKVLGRTDSVLPASGAIIDGFIGFTEIGMIGEIRVNPDEVEKVIAIPVSFFIETEPEVYRVCIKAHPSITCRNGKIRVLLPSEELALPSRYKKPWGNFLQKVYFYRYEGILIWGITARFIFDFVKKIKGLK